MDDTNALSAEESKYFETGGQADLPLVEEKAPEAVEKPEPEKQPEAKAPPEIEVVDDDDGTGEPDARKYVKVGVLRKEREQKRAAKERETQAIQRAADLERQLQALKNPPRELAPEEVPHVALQRVQQLEESLANTAAKQQFLASYQRLASDFAKEQVDFADAYKHALGVRRTMYEDAGYAPEQVNLLLESEEAAIVERAMMNGENPAAKLYKIAQTLGYKPAAKEEPKPGKTEADKVVLAAEKLAQIQKGMEKNKSVSGGGGADSAPSLAELAEMDDAEFDKATSGENWKKMMGG
jgi:hypothetical protein